MALFDSVVDFFTGTRNTDQTSSSRIAKSSDVQSTQIGGEKTAEAQQRGLVGATEQTAERQLLDTGTQDVLRSLIQSLGTQAGATVDTGALGQMLTERATTAPEDIQSSIAPIIAEARMLGERRLGQQGQRISQEAGSSLNSVVQMLQAEGGADLETKLASLEAQLGLQGRQLATDEASTALGAVSGAGAQQTQQIAQLSDILKGATETSTVTGRQEEQETVNRLLELNRVLEELQKGKTVQTGGTSSTGSESGTIIDFLRVL